MRSLFFGLAMICALLGSTVPSASAATSNEQAAQQIASNLKQSGKLKGYRVGVKYEDGVAWLTGTVTSERQLQIAQQIARNTEGVDHVICKLEVESGNESFETPVSYEERKPSRSQGIPSKPSAQRNSMPVPYAYTSPQGGVQAAAYSQSQQAQYCPDGGYADGGGMAPMGMSYTPGGIGSSCQLRQSSDARLCMAKLRSFAELRRFDLSAAVLGLGLAIHRSVLSLSAGSAWLAEGDFGMG